MNRNPTLTFLHIVTITQTTTRWPKGGSKMRRGQEPKGPGKKEGPKSPRLSVKRTVGRQPLTPIHMYIHKRVLSPRPSQATSFQYGTQPQF